ncbi:MAG: ribosomal-protein-alanine N-acetyltransferase [Arenicella sp.]|jgi:ribosomal-protein-alanine N-acetyltransferase
MTIQLRSLQASDLPNLVKYANNKKIFDNLTDAFPHPFDESKGRAFIERILATKPNHVQAITIDNELVGCIGVHPKDDVYRKNAELGYWVAESFWGKGIISDAIPKMVQYGFENFEISRIYATPYAHNVASQKALEKSGFKLEAHFKNTLFKNGEYLDEMIYAIRRD